MKKIAAVFICFLVATCAHVMAQLPVNSATGKVTFMEVVEAKTMSQENLYKVLNEWCAKQGFQQQSKDDAAFEAVYVASIPVEYTSARPGKTDKTKVNCTYSIFCKQGKYRYIVTDFVHEGEGGAASWGKLENIAPDGGKGSITSASFVLIKNKTKADVDKYIIEMKKVVTEYMNDPAKNKEW